jgi:hypothetical protein
MGWLRRDKDCISLVVVWALVLQAAISSFAVGAHAATLARGDGILLCTTRGAVVGPQLPGQSHRKTDHQCCTMACRIACGATSGGIVPLAFRVPLPSSVETPAKAPRVVALFLQKSGVSPAQPRAPPFA